MYVDLKISLIRPPSQGFWRQISCKYLLSLCMLYSTTIYQQQEKRINSEQQRHTCNIYTGKCPNLAIYLFCHKAVFFWNVWMKNLNNLKIYDCKLHSFTELKPKKFNKKWQPNRQFHVTKALAEYFYLVDPIKSHNLILL